MELDLDDLGASESPAQPASRPSRFQPKLAKIKPKPKPELATDAPPQKKQEVSEPLVDAEIKSANETKEESALKAEEEEEQAMAEPMEEDSEEDRVVREIDVFLCPPQDPNSQLCVLQYPLRPRWRPYDLDERCREVRLKPKSFQVEVDLSLDVDNNYDTSVAENLRITKQTLTSSKPPLATSYAVGLLTGNKLHLNPIHAVVQLRPSMEHLKGELKKKNEVTEEKTTGPSKKQGKAIKTSIEQNTDVESWVPLEYHGMQSSVASRYREKMVSKDDSLIQFSMNLYDYVNSLCPVSSLEGNKMGRSSRRLLFSLPLEERIKTLVSEGPQVNQFKAFKHFAPDDSDDDVLAVLQHHADLVQGLWVPKSTLLKLKGIDAAIRDYVLLLFSRSTVISSKQLEGSERRIQVPLHVLSPFAIFRPCSNDWKFKVAKDTLFLKTYPHIVRNQEQGWMNREKRIMGAVGREVGNSLKSTMTNLDGTPGKQDLKRGVNGKPSSGSMTMTDETREALSKALMEIFSNQKVCSLQVIQQSLRDRAVAKSTNPKGVSRAAIAAAQAVSAAPHELQSIVNQFATNIHGVYVAKLSENQTLNPLRNVVINLFRGKEPNAKLKKADIIEAAKISLKKDYSDTPEYNQVLNELCVSVKNAWVLKSGDGEPKKSAK